MPVTPISMVGDLSPERALLDRIDNMARDHASIDEMSPLLLEYSSLRKMTSISYKNLLRHLI